MPSFNIKNLIQLTFFCNLFIINKKIKLYPSRIHPFYLPYKYPILFNDESKREILTKGRKYLDRCLNVSENQKYKFENKPKITAIIPLYNCELTIESAIHSIQYQNISEIEIILINDFSTDNTSTIIREIQKNDKRIKIINNHRNMGTLYSRSIAALKSEGEYIFSLDNDDMYFDYDVFDYIYKRGKNELLDIIHFLAVNIFNYTAEVERMKNIFTFQYPEELFLEQPELGIWMIKFNEKFLVHNNMIWDKCIKTIIYKKAVNHIGIKRYSKYLSWAEDTSINFVIFNLAKTFKYVYKYGIAHFKGKATASETQSINTKIFGDIFFLDIIFDFSKNNTEYKNLIVGQAIYIYKRYHFNKFNNDTNSFYLKYVLNKIINCKYLNKLNKRKLNKLFNSFLTNHIG